MNVYYVTRWGNETGGPDGDDTSFIVISNSHLSASKLVDQVLIRSACDKVNDFCNRITELGVSHADREKIIVGPLIENTLYHDDIGIPDSKKWIRDNLDDGWEEFSEYY